MIASIAGQMMNGSGDATPPWLPSDATAFLDFVAGNYYAGGASRNVGDLLGGGFDAGEISGLGLHFIFSNSNRPTAVGAFLSDLVSGLAAGITLVFDLNLLNSPYGYIMFLGDAATFETSIDMIVIAANDNMYDSVSLGLGGSLSTTGLHKLAVTLNRSVGGGDYEYAWSLDGASALTQTVAYAAFAPLDSAQIGWDGSGTDELLDNVYLRSLTVYPAIPPAELPALSA